MVNKQFQNCAATILSQPTVSYHLKTMEADGLLSKKEWVKNYYQVYENCPHHEKLCLLNK
jgi:DNA-binding transcriptional ArsR family regulator